jgi:hypothetical protein
VYYSIIILVYINSDWGLVFNLFWANVGIILHNVGVYIKGDLLGDGQIQKKFVYTFKSKKKLLEPGAMFYF